MQHFKVKYIFILIVASILPTCLGSLIDEVFANSDIPFLETAPRPSYAKLSSRVAKRSLSLNYVSYNITLDGRKQGNLQKFLVSGKMFVTDGIATDPPSSTGPNAAELFISVGSPTAKPTAGSISYFSSSGLYPLVDSSTKPSPLDFATVAAVNGTTVFVVDPNSAATNRLSNFNARSGLSEDVYRIVNGTFTLTVTSDGALGGSVAIVGRGQTSHKKAPYKAVVSGHAIGKGVFHV